ncbi:EamA family transporter RarD [Paralimibaculum aggregatum]|uniref:EamA family transporter RarD n=1 Tax=Paralimibaculum aggregatum TaxID=3036245 RepID=A0ABQ6LG08_9RHOB|nr:EamA family transporter RarD [Limibaculum sp. NKW23]GMG82260.1 EamA family transporter RarD [Limibaculum sp. NKW23]
MTGSAAGIAAGLAAATIWGLNPLYFDLLRHVQPLELLSHRVLWGAVVVGLWCLATGRGPRIAEALRTRLAGLALTASLITVNWLVFLTAIQANRAVEAGLGYYLMPLCGVALGVLVLGERLSLRQWIAVGLAALAVALLLAGAGPAPVIPLVLAVSFAIYGLVRKRLGVGAISGFAVEALLLSPLAIGWLLVVHAGLGPESAAQPGAAFGRDLRSTLLLLAAGPVTGLPLVLFAEAARRLPYATAALVQYLNPTLQVFCAVVLLGETVGPGFVAALGLVWAGLALYTSELLRRKPEAKPPAGPGTGSQTGQGAGPETGRGAAPGPAG